MKTLASDSDRVFPLRLLERDELTSNVLVDNPAGTVMLINPELPNGQ